MTLGAGPSRDCEPQLCAWRPEFRISSARMNWTAPQPACFEETKPHGGPHGGHTGPGVGL